MILRMSKTFQCLKSGNILWLHNLDSHWRGKLCSDVSKQSLFAFAPKPLPLNPKMFSNFEEGIVIEKRSQA